MNTNASPQRGYTLLEALVTLFIIAEILVAVLVLFDFNSRVGRTQSQVAELQQTHRIAQGTLVRLLRSAGRGPLNRGDLPQGLAVEVWNNVGAGREIAPGFAGGPVAQEGTDVLVIRGVFTNPIYLPRPTLAGGNFQIPDGGLMIPGFVLAPFQALGLPPGSLIAQQAEPVIDAIGSALPEAFLAASAEDSSRVQLYELNAAKSDASDPDAVIVALDGTTYGGVGNLYRNRMIEPAREVENALHVGILEEYRIYVRPPAGGLVVGAANAGRDSPRLAMARVYPFTNIPHRGDAQNLVIDLAENIFDLQVVFGIDLDVDGQIDENADLGLDEWLLNDGDDVTTPPLVGGRDWNTAPPGQRRASLLFMRVSTLAMTDRPDLSYEAPVLAGLEDRTYATSSFSSADIVNEPFQRKFRRRVLTTLVDVRSL